MELRRLTIASTVVLALIGCTGDDASPPTPTTSPAPQTTARATTSTSSTSSTTTTIPPTTTTEPGAAAVAATCTVLQTGAWPDRRAAILTGIPQFEAEGGAGALADAVRASCPDDLARQEAALALEARSEGANVDEALALGDLSCGANVMSGTIDNRAPEAVGVVVAGRASRSDGPRWQSTSTLWNVPPGSSQTFQAPNAGPGGYCSMVGHVFLADDSATDAGTPSAPGPATTGDDPAVWLPALENAAGQWLAAPTDKGDADVMDLRAIVRTDLPEPATDVHPVVGVTVCPETVDQPSPDRVAFAYGIEYGPLGDHPGYWALWYAAFRRGSDGRWRYLAAPFLLDGSLTGANCAPPIPHP